MPHQTSVRIIKATGFKISILSQIGVTIEYISAIVLIWPPTLGSCYLGYILMNLGFCIIFASLLLVGRRACVGVYICSRRHCWYKHVIIYIY